jgi:hypothetical protein
MRKILAGFLFLAACGGSDPYTWGDAVSSVTVAYCERLATCGFYSDEEGLNKCIAHTEFHLCELEDTCSEKIAAEAEADVDLCVADMAEADCYFLGYWGVTPESCGPVFEYNPANEE